MPLYFITGLTTYPSAVNTGNIISADSDKKVNTIKNILSEKLFMDTIKKIINSNIAAAHLRITNSTDVNIVNFSSKSNIISMAYQLATEAQSINDRKKRHKF